MSAFSENYSGIVLTETISSLPQTFQLPADYARGDEDTIIPPFTGLQVYLTISTDPSVAVLGWEIDFDNNGTWTSLGSGTVTGTGLLGPCWFSIYFDPIAIEESWLTGTFRLNLTPANGAANPTRFRLLAATADSGTDFLGNSYRSVALTTTVSQVSPSDGGSFWLSAPSPSSFAVQSIYSDMRQGGDAVVVDRVTLDPLTPGVQFHVYYSNDPTGPGTDAASWDSLLWTPIYKPFQATRRQTVAFPEPVSAKYFKVEFTNLQPRTYDPGQFELPTTYNKYPKWILDYFLALFGNLDIDLLSAAIDVTYDALDLAFTYYSGDIIQAPDPPVLSEVPLTLTPQYPTPTSPSTTDVDFKTLGQINYNFQPFTGAPALLARINTMLGQYAATVAIDTNPSYSVETISPALGDTSVVSNTSREALLIEKAFPIMFFYLPCRHAYRVAQANFSNGIAYYAGVKSLSFHRDIYTTAIDQPQYNEIISDGANVLINDWIG